MERTRPWLGGAKVRAPPLARAKPPAYGRPVRTLGTALALIVFLGVIPVLGITETWHWSLTLALLIGVPIWALWWNH